MAVAVETSSLDQVRVNPNPYYVDPDQPKRYGKLPEWVPQACRKINTQLGEGALDVRVSKMLVTAPEYFDVVAIPAKQQGLIDAASGKDILTQETSRVLQDYYDIADPRLYDPEGNDPDLDVTFHTLINLEDDLGVEPRDALYDYLHAPWRTPFSNKRYPAFQPERKVKFMGFASFSMIEYAAAVLHKIENGRQRDPQILASALYVAADQFYDDPSFEQRVLMASQLKHLLRLYVPSLGSVIKHTRLVDEIDPSGNLLVKRT